MGRKVFDKAFKENAVKLGRQRKNQSDLAKELGISRFLLNKWIKESDEYGVASFPGRGIERLTEEQRQIKDLERSLKQRVELLPLLRQ